MSLRQLGCRDCEKVSSGDCGRHGPLVQVIGEFFPPLPTREPPGPVLIEEFGAPAPFFVAAALNAQIEQLRADLAKATQTLAKVTIESEQRRTELFRVTEERDAAVHACAKIEERLASFMARVNADRDRLSSERVRMREALAQAKHDCGCKVGTYTPPLPECGLCKNIDAALAAPSALGEALACCVDCGVDLVLPLSYCRHCSALVCSHCRSSYHNQMPRTGCAAQAGRKLLDEAEAKDNR